MDRPRLVIALMALGRDADFVALAIAEARSALAESLGPRADGVRFAALLDEAQPAHLLAPFERARADVLAASPTRSGFAGARRRALHVALALEPRGVLVCDGDGLYAGASIARIAEAWLAGDPDRVVLPRREGHTLPTSGDGHDRADRAALERMENAAGALLVHQPRFAAADLQPGALAMPASAAEWALAAVTSRDFAWDLECALGLLASGRAVDTPSVRARAQTQTTFTPADLRTKLDMLARCHGAPVLHGVLSAMKTAPPPGVSVPAELIERALRAARDA